MNEKLQFFQGRAQLLHGGDYNPDQWLDTPEVIDEDFRLMKLARCNLFSVGIFSWTSYEPADGDYRFDWLDRIMDRMAADGRKVLLATPSGAKPAWLAQAHPEICRVNRDGRREPFQARHNHCWSSPVYRRKLAAINAKLAERYAHHPALAGWHISNEYNGECCCDLCQEAFRHYLQRKYGSLERLNQAWCNSFWNHTITSWAEATPFGGSETNTLDWRRFTTVQCREFMKFEIDTVKAFNPAIPAGTNFMGFFDGLDYWRLAEISDFIADDVYPPWDTEPDTAKLCAEIAMRHDMHRAMANRNGGLPFFLMESSPSATNWQEIHRLKRPGQHRLQELTAIGHGADGTLYFQWRKSNGNLERFHGAVVDHVGHEHTRVFRDVAELGELYEAAAGVCGSSYPVRTALIYDIETKWALDCASGPGRENKRYFETLFTHYRALWRNNLPLDVIESKCDFSAYQLLVAPMLFMLQPGVAERLSAFVRDGGTLVLSYLTGYQDTDARCFRGGWPGDGLMELCGVWNEEINGLASFDRQSFRWNGVEVPVIDYHERLHPTTAQVLATFDQDFCAGEPALTCNQFGNGKVYYQAGRTGEEFLLEFYRQLAQENGIAPTLSETGTGVSATVRQTADTEYLFLFNPANHPAEVTLPPGNYTVTASGRAAGSPHRLAPFGSDLLQKQR